MSENTQAKRYSQAVFEIARDNQGLDKWQNDLQKIVALAHNAELVSVMENPKFTFTEKVQLLDKQLSDVSRMALNLAYILTEQGRFSLIISVYDEYQKMVDEHRGIAKAEITTAIPLDEPEIQNLTRRLSQITGKTIILTEKVDPSIIGGMITRVEGKIIDGSTRSQLSALKSELVNRG